ncbi:asparagine synthase (glutamine-hydrolyzing) [Ktedonosporobacter rubrisoli]|uniref:asparagine synthase (glutamine-hydrolyzing) n=1 Tax=Ktedonosporobacter rubrisoli TaxID=2509675 RepID=A0A4P6JPZ8_KTERU|nr:asparagine synthase (glutamine-hydrolyzing) [Ktedonosporobacter rubrisoli]QBD77469.1 asparagine synthase (glutamine-hydrolyzing) [Ktedonosporobacter rubrisoli]
MCGITGMIDWERDLTQQRPLLERMLRTLQARGPDAEGCWLSARAALAHRRLVVIDPQGGAQPMVLKQDGNVYVITYNGELYNFKELRSELESRGHTFLSRSDTEVLLHAYVEWREDCLHRLNGMFAFALWDENKQLLLMARDHLGIKPLFYAERAGTFLFGSELKALLAHPLVHPEIDAEGLAEIFVRPVMHTPGCGVYRNVSELRPGHYAIVDPTGIHIKPYWLLHSFPHSNDVQTSAEYIRSILEDTMQHQLIADVPVVSMLSGGLDSSGLVALAANILRQDGKKLHTYSIDFVESARDFQPDIVRPGYDQFWVERVSASVGTTHHTIAVDTPELLDNLFVQLHAHDLPGMGQLETSLYLLSKAMKQDATVAISGEAADEIFGGYFWFHQQAVMRAATFPWMVEMPLNKILSPEVLENISIDDYVSRRYREALTEIPRLAGEDAYAAKKREISYLHLTRYLPSLLERKDRMSMATGFEVRVPYCEYRLVEYVFNVPWEMKTIGRIEKGILRRALADALPNDVLYRKKSAYPLTRNPSYMHGVQQRMLDLLNTPEAPLLRLINSKLISQIVELQSPHQYSGGIASVLEYLIQINAWLTKYHVSLHL